MPVLLAYADMCGSLKNTKEKTKTSVLQAIANKLESFLENSGYSLKDPAKQSSMPPRLHKDDIFKTLEVKIDSRISGSMRTIGYFNQLPYMMSAGPPKLKLGNVVIIAAQIHAGSKLYGANFFYPKVA